MTRLALVLCGFLIYFIQAQLLPAIFHTNWLPNLILTITVMVTLFKGRRMGIMVAVVGGIVHDVLISNFFGLHLFPYIAKELRCHRLIWIITKWLHINRYAW